MSRKRKQRNDVFCTLAQDTLHLYIHIISAVQNRCKERLLKSGKSRKVAEAISRTLAESCKQKIEDLDCVDSQHFSGMDVGSPPKKKLKKSQGPKMLKPVYQKKYTNGDGVPRSHLEVRNPFDTPILSSPQQSKRHSDKKAFPQVSAYRPVIVGSEVISKKVKEEPVNDESNLSDLDGPLGSDDDDDLSDPEDVEDKLICQFERINRTKDVFNLRLHSGILNVNGKEYCFAEAQTGSSGW